jgi:hypothetical protein
MQKEAHMKRWMLFVLFLVLVGVSVNAQDAKILWEDNFNDEEELPLSDVGWFIYCDATIPGNEVKQMDGWLYIKSGNFEDKAAVGIAQTNGIPYIVQDECEKPAPESIDEIIADDYSSPNQDLTLQVKFKTIASSIFLIATRCVLDPSQLSADPQVSPAYVIMSNPLEGKLGIARFDDPGAAFDPTTWTYFAPLADFAFKMDVTYSYRLYLNEGDMKVKVWEGDFDAQPMDWLLEGVDPDPRVAGNSTILAITGIVPGDEVLVDNVTLREAGTPDAVEQRVDQIPTAFTLYPNYPNPFNPTTEISFSIEKAGTVNLAVYNQKGQLLTTLVNGHQTAGRSSVIWNGRDANGQSQPSGIYYARLSGDGVSKTIKMLLMK